MRHILIVALLIVGLGATAGCKSGNPQIPAKKFSTADLQKLNWIEGTWRGTGDNQKPFFERYRFENDSTLAVDSFPDEKLATVEDTTRFELKDGVLGGGGNDSRWVATVIDDKGVTFDPVSKAKNSFRWEQQTKDLWIATLKWPAADGKPAQERIYKMERFPAP